MVINEVRTSLDWKHFHRVPRRIYAGDPNWICPIEGDVQSVFTPGKNRAYENGEAKIWVLLDEGGAPAGRIAAFISHERNPKQAYPVGGIGFFECVDRQDYAEALFEKALEYLRTFGVKAIDGPINFGERERYWGLLVRCREAPLFQENYQPTYYRALFENWGFRPFEQIFTFKGVMPDVPIGKYRAIAQRVRSRQPVTCRYFDKKRLDVMADHMSQVYNRAFAHFDHFKPIEPKKMQELFKDFLPIADTKATVIAYYEERPIALCVLLPEINAFLRHANGRLNFLTLPGFFLRLRLSTRKKALKGILYGVDPDFHGRGIGPVMIDKLHSPHIEKHYETFYLADIRAHNRVMVDTISKLRVKVERIHIAYRKMLDASLPFEPFPFRDLDDPLIS